jgi:hypothetical protein
MGREIVDLSRRYSALLARIQEPNTGEEVWKELDDCEAKLTEARDSSARVRVCLRASRATLALKAAGWRF